MRRFDPSFVIKTVDAGTGLGFAVSGLGFGVWGLGFEVKDVTSRGVSSVVAMGFGV